MAEKKVKNSTKLFVSGVIVLTISNLIIKAIGLLFKIPMHNFLGGEGMGYYNAAYQIYTLLYMISNAGLPVATSIMIAENRSLGKIDQVKKIFKLSLGLFFVVGFVGMAIMIAGAFPFSTYVIKNEPTAFCIMAIAPTLFFICLSSSLRGYFQGYQHMLPVAVSQLIEALCKLFLGIAFAMYARSRFGEGPDALKYVAAFAVLGVTVGAGLGMIFLTFTKLLFKSDKYDAEYLEESGLDHEVTSSKDILKRIAIIAIPITISSSVMSLTNLIDTVLIQRLLQDFRGIAREAASAAYGNYTTLAVPMFNLPPVLVYPISYSVVPIITAARTKGDHERAEKIMESALRVAVLIGIPCAIGLAAMSEPILSLFYRDREAINYTAPLLSLLAPSTFFLCVLSITNAILQACGHERKPVISMAIGAVAKIGANVLLLLLIGMEGTPISTFICYLTATAINVFFILKHTDLRLNVTRVFLRPLIAGVLCGGAAVGSRYLFAIWMPGKIATVLAILSAVAVYVTLIFAIKAITEDDVGLLPKGEKIAKIIKKLKLNTVASTLIVCIVVGGLGLGGALITVSKYNKTVEATKSATGSELVSLYAEAVRLRPLDIFRYIDLVRAIDEDGEFTPDEETLLISRMNRSIADLTKQPGFGALEYEIMKMYLTDRDPIVGGKLSDEYLADAAQWSGNVSKYAADIAGYSSALSAVASFGETPEATGDTEYTEKELFEDISRLAEELRDGEDDPGVILAASLIASDFLSEYRDGMISRGVAENDIISVCETIGSTVAEILPEAVPTRFSAIPGEIGSRLADVNINS